MSVSLKKGRRTYYQVKFHLEIVLMDSFCVQSLQLDKCTNGEVIIQSNVSIYQKRQNGLSVLHLPVL